MRGARLSRFISTFVRLDLSSLCRIESQSLSMASYWCVGDGCGGGIKQIPEKQQSGQKCSRGASKALTGAWLQGSHLVFLHPPRCSYAFMCPAGGSLTHVAGCSGVSARLYAWRVRSQLVATFWDGQMRTELKQE